MYSRLPSFILGFHGCDRSVAAAVISARQQLVPSQNHYDWLGRGIYFWENSPARALDFARRLKGVPRRNKATIQDPAAIGAVIDLGHCLNLLDSKFLPIVQEGYEVLKQTLAQTGGRMPANRPLKADDQLLLRDLDCAVIESVHALRQEKGLPPFDTVRSAFIEGAELFPGSTFRDKNHIQVCVRNPRCIKGYFWPLEDPEDSTV